MCVLNKLSIIAKKCFVRFHEGIDTIYFSFYFVKSNKIDRNISFLWIVLSLYNIPRIFNLVLIEPGKSFVRVIQSIGRGIRKAEDKDFVQIWDITSTCKYAKRHLTERKKYYREAQYPFTITKVDKWEY